MANRYVYQIGATGGSLGGEPILGYLLDDVMTQETDLTTKIDLRLRAAREAQKISLAAFSDRTRGALSKSRISNYERGLRRIGLEEARMLADALGTVSATYLLCLDEEGFLSDQERERLKHFRWMDETGRETVLRVAEAQCGGRKK